MWVVNHYSNSVTRISNLSGTPASTNHTGGGLDYPPGIAFATSIGSNRIFIYKDKKQKLLNGINPYI